MKFAVGRRFQGLMLVWLLGCSLGGFAQEITPQKFIAWEAQYNSGAPLDLDEFYSQTVKVFQQRDPNFPHWAQLGYDMATATADSYHTAVFANMMAVVNKNNAAYDEALEFVAEALRIAEGKYPKLQVKIEGNYANILKRQNKTQLALVRRKKLLQVANAENVSARTLALQYGNLAGDYAALGLRDSAFYAAELSAQYAAAYTDRPDLSRADSVFWGTVLMNGSSLAIEAKEIQKAFDYLEEVAPFLDILPNKELANYYNNWGNYYYQTLHDDPHHAEKAVEFWKKSLQLKGDIVSSQSVNAEINLIGLTYYIGDVEKAMVRFAELWPQIDQVKSWTDHNTVDIWETFISRNPDLNEKIPSAYLSERVQYLRSAYEESNPGKELKPSIMMQLLQQDIFMKVGEESAMLEARNQLLILLLLLFVGILIGSFWIVFATRRSKLALAKAKEAEATNQRLVLIDMMKERDLEQQIALNSQYSTLTREVGYEIHDGLGAILSVAQYALSEWESAHDERADEPEARKVRAALEHARAETRLLSHQLKKGYEDSGATLFQRLTDFEQYLNAVQHTLTFSMDVSVLEELSLDRKVSLQVYRVVQELTQNILKHANATQVDFFAHLDEGKLVFFMEDNGQGFDTALLNQPGKGIGLHGMKERLKQIDGAIQFDSHPGSGTSVWFEVPIVNEQGD